MKNISGKNLIFYTFQTKDRNAEYNVTTFKKTSPQEPKIRDVLFELPLNYHANSYHFRFRSEFFEGDEKIIGWIDISNLLAKVPMINNTIYVKILHLPNDQANKLFNREKLKAIALLEPSGRNEQPNTPNKKVTPQVDVNKPKTQVNRNGSLLEFESPVKQKQVPKQPYSSKQPQPKQPVETEPVKPAFVPGSETPEQRHAGFIKNCEAEEESLRLDKQAAKIHQAKIVQWGYSGHNTINNLTTLLATLHVIWPEWKPVSLSDMLRPEDVAALYKKAAIRLHPDKNRNKEFGMQYLAKRVFQLLNEAKSAQK